MDGNEVDYNQECNTAMVIIIPVTSVATTICMPAEQEVHNDIPHYSYIPIQPSLQK